MKAYCSLVAHQFTMPSHKWAQDVVEEFDGGSNTSEEHHCKNKRSRMHSKAADDYWPSSQLHSSSETLQLSTSIDQPSDPRIIENDISQHQISFTLEIISHTITANNPELALQEPLPPTHMNQMPDTSPPVANCMNPELQCQLGQTWDVKCMQELEHQGEWL